MGNGESDDLDHADDWRAHTALATALVARRQAQGAVLAARRAVAMAPDEPDARLALADALLAVFPRRLGTRAAVNAELDRAELLGVAAADLADRRERSRNPGRLVIAWVIYIPFMIFGLQGQGGRLGTAIAWPAMVLVIVTTVVLRVRPPGRSFWAALGTKRKVSRKRLATDEQVLRIAPGGAAVVAAFLLPTAFLAIPGADGNPPSPVLAWFALGGIPLAVLAAWTGVDRWLRPGTVIRVLRHDGFVVCSVSITFVVGVVTPLLALREVESPGLWFGLFLGQMAWMIGNAVGGMRLCSRRKKAASSSEATADA